MIKGRTHYGTVILRAKLQGPKPIKLISRWAHHISGDDSFYVFILRVNFFINLQVFYKKNNLNDKYDSQVLFMDIIHKQFAISIYI